VRERERGERKRERRERERERKRERERERQRERERERCYSKLLHNSALVHLLFKSLCVQHIGYVFFDKKKEDIA